MNLTTWEDFERGFVVGQANQDPNDWTPWDDERRAAMRRKMRKTEVRNALILMHQWMSEDGIEGLACGATELWIDITATSIKVQELYDSVEERGAVTLSWTEATWEWKIEGSWQKMDDVFGWMWGWLISETGPRDR